MKSASSRLAVPVLLIVGLTGCPSSEKPAPSPESTVPATNAAPAAAPPPAAPPAPPAPPPAPEEPEPAGISAGALAPPAAPKGKGVWTLDPAGTDVSFTIVSNSAGPITGRFPGGASGAFDPEKRTGVFAVDLTKLQSTNKDGAPNAVRDTNVLEAFFGARPLSNAALRPSVDAVWERIAAKIKPGVARAALVIDAVEGEAAAPKEGATTEGVVNGRLVLWDSVAIPVAFPVTAARTKGVIELKGTAPATFSIEKATGSALRKALFDTMLAAGCAHQPGISNDVSVSLDKVTLRQALAKKK
jgi:hypothetical protein